MQSRFLKSLALAAVIVAIPVVAFAQTSRVAGLGVQGDYIKDYTNIYTYTSCVTGVGNLIYGEFGSWTGDTYVETGPNGTDGQYFETYDRAMGAVLGNLWDGRAGVWSFHMREFTPQLGSGDATTAPGVEGGFPFFTGLGWDPNMEDTFYDISAGHPFESFDLMWGKKFGTTSLGLRFNRSYLKLEETGSPAQEGAGNFLRNIMGFGGGVGFELNPNTTAEFSLLYQSRTYTDPVIGGEEKNDGSGAYMLSGRMFWQWQPNVTVVPVVKYRSFDLSSEFTPTGGTSTKTDIKVSGWQAGVAGNWALNQNDLFVAGLTFGSNTAEDKTNQGKFSESIYPLLFAALETHVNPWLTLRMGASKAMFYTVQDEFTGTPSDTEKISASTFNFYCGAGVKLGTLQMDATLAKDFFQSPGTYFFANGSEDVYYPLFPKVTATYSF